jgi:hypothetical protein
MLYFSEEMIRPVLPVPDSEVFILSLPDSDSEFFILSLETFLFLFH